MSAGRRRTDGGRALPAIGLGLLALLLPIRLTMRRHDDSHRAVGSATMAA